MKALKSQWRIHRFDCLGRSLYYLRRLWPTLEDELKVLKFDDPPTRDDEGNDHGADLDHNIVPPVEDDETEEAPFTSLVPETHTQDEIAEITSSPLVNCFPSLVV